MLDKIVDKSSSPTLEFKIMHGNSGSEWDKIGRIIQMSRQFVRHHNNGDELNMLLVSNRAWADIITIAIYIRKKDDENAITREVMSKPTAVIVEDLAADDRDVLIGNARIGSRNPYAKAATLRTTLNKVVHYDQQHSTYRVSNKAHYLVLSGPDTNSRKGPWVIEIHIPKLCAVCRAALRSITL